MATLLAGCLLLAACGPRARQNVLLITLDTTRADHLGCYGFPIARTPIIDRLAAEGVRCANAITAAPITLPSHSTIMTGLYPPTHGVRDNSTFALGNDATTLAERLHRVGYRTQAFVSALVLNRRYNLNKGFDGYDDDLWSERQPKMFLIRSRPGPKTAEKAVQWLASWARDKPRQPFFVWMHLFDAHQPYTVSAGERVLSPSIYDAEIGVLDRSIGLVLAELRRQGQLDNTLVIVTADHGESLGEHGEKSHGLFIYEATVRVPLILRDPQLLPRGKTYSGPVRTVDIVPTVLAALHLPGGETTQGENLLPAFRGEVPPPDLPQYSESLLTHVGFGMSELYGIRHGDWKWIRAPHPEIYDMRHDSGENTNLYSKEARRGSQLDRELAALLSDSRRRALAPQASAMDGETARQLQALGYLAPTAERETLAGLDPKVGLPLLNRLEDARHLAQHHKWAESEALIRQVMVEMPKSTSAMGILALTRLHQGDLAGAREEYLRMLAIDPSEARVYVMLGAIAMVDGDLDTAERDYRQALVISPGFVEAMSNLGMIAALRDNDAEAETWLRRATAADPSFPLASRRLADIHYERGDFAGALALYRQTLAEQPSDFASAIQAGNCARRVGRADQAERFFTQAAKDRPTSWVPIYNLACLKALHHDDAGSLALLSTMTGFQRLNLLESDKDLESVRRLPGFAPLLSKLRLERHEQRRAKRLDAEAEDDGDPDGN